MTVGKLYKITRKIKTHTNPLRNEEVTRQGVFNRETPKYYIFNGFRARKANVVSIEEAEINWDAETMKELARRIREHYPHTQSIQNTIDKEVNKM